MLDFPEGSVGLCQLCLDVDELHLQGDVLLAQRLYLHTHSLALLFDGAYLFLHWDAEGGLRIIQLTHIAVKLALLFHLSGGNFGGFLLWS